MVCAFGRKTIDTIKGARCLRLRSLNVKEGSIFALPHNRDDWAVVHLWRDLWRAQQGDSQGVGVSLRLSMFGWMCETRRARDK